jgi:hypothetical protein
LVVAVRQRPEVLDDPEVLGKTQASRKTRPKLPRAGLLLTSWGLTSDSLDFSKSLLRSRPRQEVVLGTQRYPPVKPTGLLRVRVVDVISGLVPVNNANQRWPEPFREVRGEALDARIPRPLAAELDEHLPEPLPIGAFTGTFRSF